MPKETKSSKMSPREAGSRGGQVTSQRHGPEFFAEIGSKGGRVVSQNRAHMSRIGQKGGAARNKSTRRNTSSR